MEHILEFQDLYRSMGNRNSFIKESGSVAAGGILSIKGPSGSGKSTLLRMLARLISPESGEMYLRGQHWRSIPPGMWRRRVQYLAQKPVMLSGTVEDNFSLPFAMKSVRGQTAYARGDVEPLMKELDLPLELITKNAQTLSGGEASRVALIRALLVEPEVLLLDEPTAYLDAESRLRVVQLINRWVKEQPDRAVIMVSHNQEDVAALDQVTVLEIGPGKEGLPGE